MTLLQIALIAAIAAALALLFFTLGGKKPREESNPEADLRIKEVGRIMETYHRTEDGKEKEPLIREAMEKARAIRDAAPGYRPAVRRFEACEAVYHQMINDKIKAKVSFIMMDAGAQITCEKKLEKSEAAFKVLDDLGRELHPGDPGVHLLRGDLVMFQQSCRIDEKKKQGEKAEEAGDRAAALAAYEEAMALLEVADDRLIVKSSDEIKEKIGGLKSLIGA